MLFRVGRFRFQLMQAVAQPGRLSAIVTFSAALAVLMLVACLAGKFHDEADEAMQRAIRVAALREKFVALDDWLTMSARLAASTGEARWIARYEEGGPQLAAAMAEAQELATPAALATLAETTDEAITGLVLMERTAMTKAAGGEKEDATALLDGPEFNYLQAVYASGMEVFGQDLQLLAETRTKELNRRAWLETWGAAFFVIIVLAALFARRGHRRVKVALARTELTARTDHLTGLANRRHLYQVLQDLLARPAETKGQVAFLLLDLDHFKLVNDVHGHLAGDRLLQQVAARLRTLTRTGDVLARLGGDEFAVIIPFESSTGAVETLEAVATLAGRIVSAMGQPFELGDMADVQIGVSLGVSVGTGQDEAEEVIRRADVALYRAKTTGRCRFCVHDPEMDTQLTERTVLEADFRRAVADDTVVPHFQPLVDMRTQRVIGFEMLARWPHPTRGMISPAEFIPLAEEIGLIGAMTERLLRRGCRVAAEWPADLMLACNVSPLQLRDRSLPPMIRAVLDETGLPPSRLEVEITESALVGDTSLAKEVLGELKALGIRLALDDFGTGYASLRHMQMLPFDKLKIDASFVGGMAADAGSRKIVTAVIGLAQSLGLITVAEGIEDAVTAAALRELGCDVGQGWLFGRPGSAGSVAAALAD